AARNSWNRRIVAAFQPHTYTRTMHLHEQFAASFDDADVIIITDVYPAREQPIEGITGKLIADGAMKYGHKNVLYIPTLDELRRQLSDILKDGDVFITIGAGNICNLSQI
ncbi:MAG TPA: cyanophycin synthetase, partial [Candidatus Kapabacteria bacterium]|nr:cyanophycin synthetase [Candidatus Kapabacteria bacterium]